MSMVVDNPFNSSISSSYGARNNTTKKVNSGSSSLLNKFIPGRKHSKTDSFGRHNDVENVFLKAAKHN